MLGLRVLCFRICLAPTMSVKMMRSDFGVAPLLGLVGGGGQLLFCLIYFRPNSVRALKGSVMLSFVITDEVQGRVL